MRSDWRAAMPLAMALAMGALGCGTASTGPPAIAVGMSCHVCGMRIEDVRWACERRDGREWRVYDSIECLLGDRAGHGPAWLTDWDDTRLHPADSLWVVRADVPSPMGGGYAAFLDRATAENIAGARRGRVAHLAEWAGAAAGNAP